MKKAIKILTITAAIMAASACASDPESPLVEYRVTAEKGDTVWGLCAKVASNRDNLMEVVYRAMKENDLEQPEKLQPGHTIRIKVKPM